MREYTKAIVGGIALISTALTGALADDVLGADEQQHIILVVVNVGIGIYAIYEARNKKKIDGDSTP